MNISVVLLVFIKEAYIKMKPLFFVAIYIGYYMTMYGFLFSINRVFGPIISATAVSISGVITAFITGIPLAFLFYYFSFLDFDKPYLSKTNLFATILGVLHPIIVSRMWRIII